ncbi:MAG: 2,3-bisphosphoglycerate-independent phosphoglycerate mutase [Patescibacteria group bacterium]|jgi:2,3-bisphosphoglycerate-independent phosphoglycerate mutase
MPHALIILDGWGIAPASKGNAIAQARTPNFDYLWSHFPHTQLAASGSAVGLPAGRDGNSEAGHMNIGAGRVVEQDAVAVNKQIKSGTFFRNPALLNAIQHAQVRKTKLHLMGMLANRMSAHAYQDHLDALLQLCERNNIKPYLHLFTDGRDAPPHEAIKLLKGLQDRCKINQQIATIMGRSYAMDRNKHWDNTAKAYHAMVCGVGEQAESAEAAITRSYNRNETDEFIKPYIINSAGLIESRDSIIFFNLRSDRARQITKTFVQPDFNKRNPGAFRRQKVLRHIKFITMTDFGPDLDHVLSAFPAADLNDTLPIALSPLRQLYIAESEKYAHVTYFFNGGYDHAVNGEKWCKIPSPQNPDYTVVPAMSAENITDHVLKTIKNNAYDFYVINFANADMLGHTGNVAATIKGVEVIDEQLGRLWQVFKKSGILFITADHGNAEEMLNLTTQETDTEHSNYPVPFIITKPGVKLAKTGQLANIAPTILKVLNIVKPKAMTSKALC